MEFDSNSSYYYSDENLEQKLLDPVCCLHCHSQIYRPPVGYILPPRDTVRKYQEVKVGRVTYS